MVHMPDNAPGTEILDLSTAFPPVSTEEWEAVIRKDLKGADYEKELVWRTDEGISVRPYYRQENLQPLGESVDLAPGQKPFTRGGGHAWLEAQSFTPPPDAIRADSLHESGATAVQELAFALAEAVEKLQRAIDAGVPVQSAAPTNSSTPSAPITFSRSLNCAPPALFGPSQSKPSAAAIPKPPSLVSMYARPASTKVFSILTPTCSASQPNQYPPSWAVAIH
jgi:hypothetical protein